MQIAGTRIKIKWTGESFSVPGRGLICTATILNDVKRGQLSELIGKTLENHDGIYCRIRAVESHAVGDDVPVRMIGLLLDLLEKPF
jgi:hypothetical protein